MAGFWEKGKGFGIRGAKGETFVIIMREVEMFGKGGGGSKYFWQEGGKMGYIFR